MKILPLARQFEIIDRITKNRIDTLMPDLMKETGTAMWIILSGEYNEDPVFKTMMPASMLNAGRITCIIFSYSKEKGYEAVSINKPNKNLSKFYQQIPYSTDTQWQEIKNYITERNPENIALNISEDNGLCSGLSHGFYKKLTETLGTDLSKKIISGEKICTRWLEQRTPEEIQLYPEIYKVTTEVLNRAFSKEVITPGSTTTEEIEFFIREQFGALGLPLSFPPDVNLQRKGEKEIMITGTILHGDLLHFDAGIGYLGLHTDFQRLAYVLHPHEQNAPEDILKGFQAGRQFGDIVAAEFIEDRTGNEIFENALAKGNVLSLNPTLYTHPIGKYCHSAGPIIGLYDKQGFIPIRGENKLYKNTAYALEYNVCQYVPCWEQNVYFYLEETVTFTENGNLNYLDHDYQNLILI